MLKKINYIFSYDRWRYENFLDDENNKLSLFVSQFITGLVISFVIVTTLTSIWEYDTILADELLWFDAFVSTIFAIEYIYRFLRAKHKLKFFTSPMRIIDLFSFLPFFLWLIAVWEFVKILRLLKILRILRLVKKIPLTASFMKSLKDYKDEYKAVLILFLIILFLGSFCVYYIEKDVVWSKFTSIPMTLWWGLVTMTTVWFGDMYPTTVLGKLFWSALVFLWPLVLALTSAVSIMVFMETTRNQRLLSRSKRWKVCSRCMSRNVKEANYCTHCGDKFS
jgi:voltage-gated potassium channel